MRGRMIMISISNTKKRTARRKNRIEKGRRAFDRGLNPHSKGALNSRSLYGGKVIRLNSGESNRIRGGSISVINMRGIIGIIGNPKVIITNLRIKSPLLK